MMLDCCLPEGIKANKKNKKIVKILKKYSAEYKKEIRLLLLGTGEAGKSTFIRQMKILYVNGYDDEERKKQIELIHQNIFNSMQHMIRAMEMLRIDYEKPENAKRNATLITHVDCENATYLDDSYLSAIKELWRDSGIQKCYMRRNEYQLNDSTKYYLMNIDRIAQPGYIPTDQDILRIRVATTGLVEQTFQVNNVKFRMIDVGGQRSERRKWMQCFDNVKSIIFLVAISEYDQVLMECAQRNRLKESKEVFNSIVSWWEETPIILFLNKIDLFEEKIMFSHLDEYFPEFNGPRQNVEAAREFIRDMFLNVSPKNKMYHYFTCATNTEYIQVVFSAVRDIILSKYLTPCYLL